MTLYISTVNSHPLVWWLLTFLAVFPVAHAGDGACLVELGQLLLHYVGDQLPLQSGEAPADRSNTAVTLTTAPPSVANTSVVTLTSHVLGTAPPNASQCTDVRLWGGWTWKFSYVSSSTSVTKAPHHQNQTLRPGTQVWKSGGPAPLGRALEQTSRQTAMSGDPVWSRYKVAALDNMGQSQCKRAIQKINWIFK